MPVTSYLIALGSNRRGRFGAPACTIRAAARALGVERLSTVRATAAIGPAGRGFANAAAILRSDLDPPALLAALKALERRFGRRPGRRWGPRVIDLDIILWSGGSWGENGLVVPHPDYRGRAFVLEPLAEIAPHWRDPLTGATPRHLLHRLRRARPVDPTGKRF
jgi:2-amino-4-hydroxy-6-hydroxymethyldihydropteridine diphosphokinase